MSDANFPALLEKIAKLSARLPCGGTAVVWSGTDEKGVRNSANADACVNTPGGNYYTIAQTQVGNFLDGEALGITVTGNYSDSALNWSLAETHCHWVN